MVTLLVAALVLGAASPAAAKKKKKKPKDAEELFNPLLGVEYSHWLVGPIVEIASADEVWAFLDLISDEEAVSFVEDFWKQRNEGTGFFEESPQQLFDKRAVEADKRFTEGSLPGRRTDRGTIYILFGEPEEVEYSTPDRIDEPTLEIWKYPEDAEAGLTDEPPKKSYRFVEVGGSTVLYNASSKLKREMEDRRKPKRLRISSPGR